MSSNKRMRKKSKVFIFLKLQQLNRFILRSNKTNSRERTIESKRILARLNKLKQRDNNVLLYPTRNSLNTRYRSRAVSEYKSRFTKIIGTFGTV